MLPFEDQKTLLDEAVRTELSANAFGQKCMNRFAQVQLARFVSEKGCAVAKASCARCVSTVLSYIILSF